MDEAGRVSHQSSMWPDVACGIRRSALVPRLNFFFFIYIFLIFISWIRADSAWFASNRADSARIGLYRLYRSVTETAKIGLESCWRSRNWLWMRPKHPKSVLPQFYSEYLLLLLCFLFGFVFLAFFFLCFVNQCIVMYFFKNILIVKIYRKYK